LNVDNKKIAALIRGNDTKPKEIIYGLDKMASLLQVVLAANHNNLYIE
jgi:hypothetical protein